MSNASAVQTHHDTPIDVGIPLGKIGIWWFLASEIMVFGGLIGSYVLYRMASAGAWAEMAQHVNTPIAIINTVVLLTSSLTMVLAHAAVEDGSQPKARNYLGLLQLACILLWCRRSWRLANLR